MWFIVLTAFSNPATSAETLPPGAIIIDPDIKISPTSPSISPDGKWLAYVSRGYVCVCNIETPKPRQIMEVPHSWTWPHFQAPAGHSSSSGSFEELIHGLSHDEYNDVLRQVTSTIYGCFWTFDSSGFVFGVQQTSTPNEVYLASVEGEITKLAHVGSDALTRGAGAGILTRDKKYLVSGEFPLAYRDRRPLIWDVANNKPRATCFLSLTPSTTSGRWIGIEKDTQQLVEVDDQFEVIKRFDETMPDRSYGLRIDWSPDERFILWRNQVGFDHFSNWEGFRLNLDTDDKRKFSGRFMDEQFGFTGRGGEVYHCGQTGVKTEGYDAVVGAHLAIVPESDAPETDVWQIKVDPKGPMPGLLPNRPGNPTVHYDLASDLFAIGLPRHAGERPGVILHLMDRTGKAWRMPGDDNGEFVSPFELVGFADEGRLIVAYDASRLFSLPISTVRRPENEMK